MSKRANAKRLALPFLYVMATALEDIRTTKRAVALGGMEFNPIVRPLIKRGRYDLFFVWKMILLSLSAADAVRRGRTSEERVALVRKTFLYIGNSAGAIILVNRWTIKRCLKHIAQNDPSGSFSFSYLFATFAAFADLDAIDASINNLYTVSRINV